MHHHVQLNTILGGDKTFFLKENKRSDQVCFETNVILQNGSNDLLYGVSKRFLGNETSRN